MRRLHQIAVITALTVLGVMPYQIGHAKQQKLPYLLLAEIYGQQGNRSEAEAVLRQAQQVESLSPRDRARVMAMLQKWSTPGPLEGHKTDNR